MRPDLAPLKENFPYFASVGPTFIFVTFTVRSCFAIWCHCGLPTANFELEVAIVTVPISPLFKKETARKRTDTGKARGVCAQNFLNYKKADMPKGHALAI